MDIETPKKRPRTVALTKKQLTSAIGIELLAICQEITSDGRISLDEANELKSWLAAQAEHDLPGISHLAPIIEHILADGAVTSDEESELFAAIEAVLPPDIRSVAKGARRSIAKEQRREERELNRNVGHWDFMVAGTKYENRQATIETLVDEGDVIYLVREPHNKFSKNAVSVRIASGQEIGNMPESCATLIAPLLDEGLPYTARVKKILGYSHEIPVVVAQFYKVQASVPGIIFPGQEPINRAAKAAFTPPPVSQQKTLHDSWAANRAAETACPPPKRTDPEGVPVKQVIWGFGLLLVTLFLVKACAG